MGVNEPKAKGGGLKNKGIAGELASASALGPQPLAFGAPASGLEKLIRDATAHSLWPLMLGLDYATLELFCAIGPHHDLARFGSEVFRPSPRQVDLLVVGGLVNRKMAPVIRRLWEGMAEPRFVMALGSGAISGAPFQDSYMVDGGVDQVVPVDVYVPGDPPRPEAVIDGILRLRDAILSGEVRR